MDFNDFFLGQITTERGIVAAFSNERCLELQFWCRCALWCTGRVKMTEVVNRSVNQSVHAYFEIGMHPQIPGGGGGGGTLIFCGYIGKAPASTPKPKKLLRFADHPPKYQSYQEYPKKYLNF